LPSRQKRFRRIIVVGLGAIGRRHARLLQERTDLEVEACEPGTFALEQARAEIGSIKVYDDFDQALATRPDALLIATPHSLHARQAIAGMRANAHVLCEKPLCVDANEAWQMVTCARETARALVVGFQLHFHPGILRMRELMQQGVIGNVIHAHVRVGSYITLRNSLSHYQKALEGSLLLDYAHQPDALLWLFNELPR
jgi:predicted dehydrogenase